MLLRSAVVATIVNSEFDRFLEEGSRDIFFSSCFHSVDLLIQKYFPKSLEYLASVVSPMQAHCSDIKKRIQNAKTVFIGPCVAKKDEASYYEGYVDAVLTFEELTEWLDSENVELEPEMDFTEESRARFFPTTGGILKTMNTDCRDYTYMAIDGVDNCIAALKDIERGEINHCFIEMSACVGSCIGGPVMEKFHRTPIRDYKAIADYAGELDFEVEQPSSGSLYKRIDYIARKSTRPSEQEINVILKDMGKNKPEDELNCGSCGYDSCREKAAAIFEGKAVPSMCLPFLKDCFSFMYNSCLIRLR